MRILVHDYPGHAFPVQLSRELARRGHDVLHLYFEEFQSPKGPLRPKDDDPAGLRIRSISLGEPFQKYSFVRRWMQEQSYAGKLLEFAQDFRPTMIIGGNAPLDPQAKLQNFALAEKIPFVFWLQDVYGVAIDKILRAKLGWLGGLVGGYYMRMEKRLWKQSNAIVVITEDFIPVCHAEGVERERMHLIENWAALTDLPQRPLDNPWREAQGLTGKFVFLYSGTLGLKHNPALLVELAKDYRDRSDVAVVVVTEGIGREYLAQRKEAEKLDNLVLLPFQDYDVLPDVIGTGDVLVVLLEPDAGVYSVPSKTLTYLCAGRPILGGIPLDNLAARIITREAAGMVAAPQDVEGFLTSARHLSGDVEWRARMAVSARAYAEKTFDIAAIGERFEHVLQQARAHMNDPSSILQPKPEAEPETTPAADDE
jgi:glycosyltransferase involved in cell wall biosynthesis